MNKTVTKTIDETSKSVKDIIEEVSEDICDNYCKWGDLLKGIHFSEAELDEFYEAHCNHCPLNKLR